MAEQRSYKHSASGGEITVPYNPDTDAAYQSIGWTPAGEPELSNAGESPEPDEPVKANKKSGS